MTDKLLEIEDLRIEFQTEEGIVHAVNGVSLELNRGETLGIVGESGSGKSVMNLALLGLIPQPPGRIRSGRALFRGQDLLQMSRNDLSTIRGNRIAMIFQDPMTSLNPFLTVERQLTEVTQQHLGYSRKEARHHAIAMLERVGIPAASRRIHSYPHEFSGGMRQRVMVAMALACRPDILIADEPTTALDVTIQAQILNLMRQLQQEEGTAILLITHDLGIVAGACHRVNVMYAGQFVEEARVDDLFADPRHPYTVGLMESVPRLDERHAERLQAIPGQPPLLLAPPRECPFAPRCGYAVKACREGVPPAVERGPDHRFACLIDVRTAALGDASK